MGNHLSKKNDGFQNLWDNTAVTYSLFNDNYFPARLKLDLLKKYATRSSRCLDIGIANGIYSIPLSSFVDSIDGIDISDGMLFTCQEILSGLSITNISLHNQSAETLDFADETFNLVYSFATLALVPDVDKAFHELSRVLKRGGIAVLDITGKTNLSRFHWEKYYRAIGHFGINSFAFSDFKNKMLLLNLETIENHSIGILDQWKYIPGLNKIKGIESITHATNAIPDLDYRVSQLFPGFANHWIFVLRKK
jgi:ubiquinone/menaquinone biosynthesis C-methylase UbiE